MKRNILGFFISICLLLSITIPSMAVQTDAHYVIDEANLLTNEQQVELENKAQQISEQYQCAVHIVTVEDYTIYNPNSIEAAAETIYHESYSLGYGEEQNGILLLLSMSDRDYDLCAYGTGNTAFTDYGKEQLAQEFLDDFAEDDWYNGFIDYLDISEKYLSLSAEGTPFDVDSESGIGFPAKMAIVILFPTLIAVGVCFYHTKKLDTVQQATSAEKYAAPDGVNVRVSRDIFTHTSRTRVKIEKHDSSSGGTTVNSSGHSHSSGKF